jgi:hypothetical protein
MQRFAQEQEHVNATRRKCADAQATGTAHARKKQSLGGDIW